MADPAPPVRQPLPARRPRQSYQKRL